MCRALLNWGAPPQASIWTLFDDLVHRLRPLTEVYSLSFKAMNWVNFEDLGAVVQYFT